MLDLVVAVAGLAIMAFIPATFIYVLNLISDRREEKFKDRVRENDEKIRDSDIDELVRSVNERNKRINSERE